MKPKVLLIQNQISHYRIPVYNLISKECDLTVMYSFDSPNKDLMDFKTLHIKCKKQWKFFVHQQNIKRICNDYDVVISMMSPNWLSLFRLCFFRKKFKLIQWGIGVPASYSVHFDDSKKSIKLLKFMAKKSDAVVFYSEYAKNKYINLGFNPNKLFVANNTVEVSNKKFNNTRNEILFIGTLYREKGVDLLLRQYKRLFDDYDKNNIPKLRIIGDGPDFERLVTLTNELGMNENVIFTGSIIEEDKIAYYFSKALLCVSPTQAGLSVQKSLGYGVSFCTSKNSFTGGEIFDIVDKPFGYLFNDVDELYSILSLSCIEKDVLIYNGQLAREYYQKNRTISKMAEGVINAIKYSVEEGKNEN